MRPIGLVALPVLSRLQTDPGGAPRDDREAAADDDARHRSRAGGDLRVQRRGARRARRVLGAGSGRAQAALPRRDRQGDQLLHRPRALRCFAAALSRDDALDRRDRQHGDRRPGRRRPRGRLRPDAGRGDGGLSCRAVPADPRACEPADRLPHHRAATAFAGACGAGAAPRRGRRDHLRARAPRDRDRRRARALPGPAARRRRLRAERSPRPALVRAAGPRVAGAARGAGPRRTARPPARSRGRRVGRMTG